MGRRRTGREENIARRWRTLTCLGKKHQLDQRKAGSPSTRAGEYVGEEIDHGQVEPGRLAGIDVARIVKKLVERAGLDANRYAGHSLRAGHATSAAIAGASERSIMNQTGHRSVQMVRRYIREGNLFRDNSASKLGL